MVGRGGVRINMVWIPPGYTSTSGCMCISVNCKTCGLISYCIHIATILREYNHKNTLIINLTERKSVCECLWAWGSGWDVGCG